MTERTQGQKWLLTAFFTAIGLFFIYFIISVSKGNVDPVYNRRPPGMPLRTDAPRTAGELVLHKDQPQTFGRLLLTYRGISNGDLVLDVVLLELDPDYPYRHRIPKNSAAQGFRMANTDFRILSAGPKKLSLEPKQP